MIIALGVILILRETIYVWSRGRKYWGYRKISGLKQRMLRKIFNVATSRG